MPNEIITDIISAIEGKQLMIIGEMGTGKSTLAQYLAYTVGGKVKVYECEGTPDDWVGLEVIGKGENWSAIEQGMLDDLDELSNQMKIRNERGDNALVGTEKVIICEEYPELVSKVECSSEWLERHARRGRKARRFTILLSQYDRVSAWGLEGKSDLADAFYRLRLGKKAVSHAKSLKDDALISWLLSDRSHCLLDDAPCKLPSYREMKAVTVRLQLPAVTQNHQETTIAQNDLLPRGKLSVTVNSSKSDLDTSVLKRAILGLLEAGMSDSRVIKEVMGYEGGNYQKGKLLLEELKRES
jgi:energy-coupling factor transporter ATP-binding protein EcfA2